MFFVDHGRRPDFDFPARAQTIDGVALAHLFARTFFQSRQKHLSRWMASHRFIVRCIQNRYFADLSVLHPYTHCSIVLSCVTTENEATSQ
jgi:hypothetical protein